MTLVPASVEDAAEALRACTAQRRTISFSGGDAAAGPAAVATDERLSTRALDRVIEYAPSDQIVRVEAGMTLAALQATLGEKGQRLAIDAPAPERTTIGGLVASNGFGPLRARFGTLKDLVIGMTIVRADGVIARGGGKVVKNVAGFDVPKLMIGTYGTLALIANVTFRLHPLPRESRTLRASGLDAAAVRALVGAMTTAQLEPSALVARLAGERYDLDVTFEGFARGVRAQADRFRCVAASAVDVEPMAETRDAELVVKITAPASELEALHLRAIAPLVAQTPGAAATLYPSVGIAYVCAPNGDAQVLRRARAWAESVGGALVLEAAPAELRAQIDAWGTPPPAFALMRALKERFDPLGLLQPGGFVGGL